MSLVLLNWVGCREKALLSGGVRISVLGVDLRCFFVEDLGDVDELLELLFDLAPFVIV